MAENGTPRIDTDFRTLWGRGGLSWWKALRYTYEGFSTHDLEARSAQFAYSALFAIAPLLLVLLAILAQLPLQGLVPAIERTLDLGLPEDAADVVQAQIEDVQKQTGLGVLLTGLFMLGLAGSRIFLAISQALDACYGVHESRSFWKTYGLGVLLTVGMFVLFVISITLLVVGPVLMDFVLPRLNVPWASIAALHVLRWAVALAFLLLTTSVLYWIGPTVSIPWYWISPGSVFATVGWLLATQGFRVYVENFAQYNETYGTLGGIIVLMTWLYLTGMLLLAGGEMNSVIHRAAHGMEPVGRGPIGAQTRQV